VNLPIWHPICQRGVAKEEKVQNLAKLSGVAKEEKNSPQFGKTKWSWQKHEK
jgi:hypothetical protein